MVTTVEKLPKPVHLNSEGTLRVGKTRVSLDSVVYAFNRGEDAAEIQRNFDALTLAEVYAAIAYYLNNRSQVDKYLADNASEFDKRRKRDLEDSPNQLTREKLVARKKDTGSSPKR